MKLLPALKQKKRYVVFEILSDDKFTFVDIKEAVDKGLSLYLGQLGLSRSSPLLIKEKILNNKFIIKVNHKYVSDVISGVLLIKSIKNKPVIVRSIITSGTIKKASEKL